MSEPWPGRWQSKSMSDTDSGTSLANDHGTLYLVGDKERGEWLMMTGDPPENTC